MKLKSVVSLCTTAGVFLFAASAAASEGVAVDMPDLTTTAWGYSALILFAIAYAFVIAEEFTHLRKSKPVLLAAGLMWGMIAIAHGINGETNLAEEALRGNLLEYGELFLFLLVAMTYINALQERQVFEWLKSWLIRRGFGYRQLFWITGALAFVISPVADNLTTALLMGAVVMTVGADNNRFVALSCINIVVAANAGGAFSPFGDITTLMVWQKGLVDFSEFFALFLPALVSWLVPAVAMHFAIPNVHPEPSDAEVQIRRGGVFIIGLFLATIVTAINYHNFLNLPPVVGMMMGLAYLQFYGYYLKKTRVPGDLRDGATQEARQHVDDVVGFDVFKKISRAEWDTLLFFYGVILCVGALGTIGYLAGASSLMYGQLGPTFANTLVGFLSAIVDNIPVMFAVLTMNPEMSHGQWLLVTLTAGIGGSLLSVGSAAGVALMGQARGKYTFFAHLRWTPLIALGYMAGIGVHLWVNAAAF